MSELYAGDVAAIDTARRREAARWATPSPSSLCGICELPYLGHLRTRAANPHAFNGYASQTEIDNAVRVLRSEDAHRSENTK